MSDPLNGDKIRVMLLTTARSYRNAAFLAAADRLNIEIIQTVDVPESLSQSWEGGFGVDFSHLDEAVRTIQNYHQEKPLRAILAVDDSGSILAASASAAIGLPHNSITAAEASRDKLRFREVLSVTDLNNPAFIEYRSDETISCLSEAVGFPCVVKPRQLNGSRGVIRADNEGQFQEALQRSANLLRSVQGLPRDALVSLLVESYIPGIEVALEGILDNGDLEILALFDKPDPLEGPFFEETIYVTPSRLSLETQASISHCVAEAATAIGLCAGAIHAELRVNEYGPWILEIAGRSIGGMCSQVLQFGTSSSLEEIILRQCCGLPYDHLTRQPEARGVMMIPIPAKGLLRQVEGLADAHAVPNIDRIEITAPLNNTLTPLPEGDGYLGFIFASGDTPDRVEEALRLAHDRLTFQIDPLLPIV